MSSFRQVKDAAVERSHVLALLNNANSLQSELIDAETGQRGYLLTTDKVFLEPYLSVRDSIKSHLEELRQSTLIDSAGNTLTHWFP